MGNTNTTLSPQDMLEHQVSDAILEVANLFNEVTTSDLQGIARRKGKRNHRAPETKPVPDPGGGGKTKPRCCTSPILEFREICRSWHGRNNRPGVSDGN